ncbi:GxGYxYP domain-containing protein [Gaoshiqia sediminis]|uniref:GxGYxYP family putative glycoside hydrolase n=1 Tax=Gaoshiqia sediminis TaxID=2986998 RepID=A0AA42C9G5_9BACT|nr:GxGYxYP domain-containing protein [Gaoshiqia sediminis]MCW0483931.1 GxGYxYP family putative glycoside hydrolase [Gaoshiqia sediminis]
MKNSDRLEKVETGSSSNRRDFLKSTGMLTGGSMLGSLIASPLLANINSSGTKDGRQDIFYCDMIGEEVKSELSYWESLLFRCYQGIVNRHSAKVYFNTYERGIFLDWYKKYGHLNFKKFGDPYALLNELGWEGVNGYVVVDPLAPESINIAANYASLENLLPVTEELLKGKKLPGLAVRRDLREAVNGIKFRNLNRLETYQWVYENQWPDASRDLVTILSGAEYKNGKLETNFYTSNNSRDYPVAERALFFDLSSNPTHKEEYALKDKILSELNPHATVWGWHGARDSEHQHISQMSKHGKIAVGGANVVPNFSFHSRVKVENGVKNFKKRNIEKKIDKSLKDKIYLAFILSDGDSLNHLLRNAHGGQWLSKERGKIPFNWEMQTKLADIGPGILDYFQATATENDHFVASASGMGYTFPGFMPADKLKSHLYATKPYLQKTGLSSLVVLNSYRSLTEEKMAIYNEALGPDITGIVQGYTRAPGMERMYGSSKEDGKISDYMVWLSNALPIAHTDTVEDMEEYLNLLAKRRTQRPLFVPIHIPRSYFKYPDMVKLMGRLDENTFEATDCNSFFARFAAARTNQIGLNLPEYFMPESVVLRNGRFNKIFVRLQNFGDEKVEARVHLKLTCEAWTDPSTSSQTLEIEGKDQAEIGLTVNLRNKEGRGKGELEYLVNNNSVIKIPVSFI